MKIEKKNDLIIIDCGFLAPTYKLEISKIESWEFVVEETETIYFSFKSKKSTQYVSILPIQPEELEKVMQEVSNILKMKPEIHISKFHLSNSKLILAADAVMSTSILAAILSSMGR